MRYIYYFCLLIIAVTLVSCTSTRQLTEAEILFKHKQYEKSLGILKSGGYIDSVINTNLLIAMNYYQLGETWSANKFFEEAAIKSNGNDSRLCQLYLILLRLEVETRNGKRYILKKEGLLLDNMSVYYSNSTGEPINRSPFTYINSENILSKINELTSLYEKEEYRTLTSEILNYRGLLKLLNCFESGEYKVPHFEINETYLNSAVKDFDEAIKFDSDFAPAYKNRADAEYLLNTNSKTSGVDSVNLSEKLGKIQKDYETAIKIDPFYAEANFNLGLVRLMNNNNEGCKNLVRAIELGEKSAEFYIKNSNCR